MVLELEKETYEFFKNSYSQYMPMIEMCFYDIDPLYYYKNVNEGVERVDYDYTKLYSRDIQLTRKTPYANNAEYNDEKECLLIELSQDNPHDIQVYSELYYYNSSDYDIGLYFDVNDEKIHFSNKDLSESHIYFIVIFDIVKKGTNFVDCSVHITIFLDNPVYYNCDNYINHDNLILKYYSRHASKPSYIPSCICHLDMFGSDRCSLKKYLSTKTIHEYIREFKNYLDDNKHTIGHQEYCDMCVVFSNLGYEYPTNFNKMSDLMFDIKDKISDGVYLNMMDILMKIKQYL